MKTNIEQTIETVIIYNFMVILIVFEYEKKFPKILNLPVRLKLYCRSLKKSPYLYDNDFNFLNFVFLVYYPKNMNPFKGTGSNIRIAVVHQ